MQNRDTYHLQDWEAVRIGNHRVLADLLKGEAASRITLVGKDKANRSSPGAAALVAKKQ
jgi:hypothetical protein